MKIGDLVKIKRKPMRDKWARKPKMGLIVSSLNDQAFKVWLTDGTFVSKLANQLEIVSSV